MIVEIDVATLAMIRLWAAVAKNSALKSCST